MKHASSRDVFEYWNKRRGYRIAPERGDIEPGPIRRALGDTFILAQDTARHLSLSPCRHAQLRAVLPGIERLGVYRVVGRGRNEPRMLKLIEARDGGMRLVSSPA